METHGGKTWTGGKSQLSTRLAKMNDDGIIYFDASKRDTKTKTNLTMWCFESLDEGRKRWDRKFNDGEDSFHLLRPYAHYAHFSQVRKNNRGKVIILFHF